MKVYAHLDLDCFYAQVEHKRLNIPMSVPLAVQQWNMVIAVNYAARPFGIKRGMSAADCKAKCPNIVLAQVEYVTAENSDSRIKKVSLERYRIASEQIMSIFVKLMSSYSLTPKLEDVSGNILALSDETGCLFVEKMGTDEAFIEIDTSLLDINDALQEIKTLLSTGQNLPEYCKFDISSSMNYKSNNEDNDCGEDNENIEEEDDSNLDFSQVSGVNEYVNYLSCSCDLFSTVDGRLIDITDEFDVNLLLAAVKIAHIRKVVFDTLGYTVSGGIAGNRILAKQASAARKPNKQTLVPKGCVGNLMKELKIDDLRGLGGKLGRMVKNYTKMTHVHQLLRYELREFCEKYEGKDEFMDRTGSVRPRIGMNLGEKAGTWIYYACRGIDLNSDYVEGVSTVTNKSNQNHFDSLLPKSICANKSFPGAAALKSAAELLPWVTVLCSDIHKRLVSEDADHCRRAKCITVFHRGYVTASKGSRYPRSAYCSRSARLPNLHHSVPSLDELIHCAMRLIETKIQLQPPMNNTPYPCCGIGIGASDFVKLDTGPSVGKRSIIDCFAQMKGTSPVKTESSPVADQINVMLDDKSPTGPNTKRLKSCLLQYFSADSECSEPKMAKGPALKEEISLRMSTLCNSSTELSSVIDLTSFSQNDNKTTIVECVYVCPICKEKIPLLQDEPEPGINESIRRQHRDYHDAERLQKLYNNEDKNKRASGSNAGQRNLLNIFKR